MTKAAYNIPRFGDSYTTIIPSCPDTESKAHAQELISLVRHIESLIMILRVSRDDPLIR